MTLRFLRFATVATLVLGLMSAAHAQEDERAVVLGHSLVHMGFVRDEDITALLSKQYGVPSINLAQFTIDPAVISARVP